MNDNLYVNVQNDNDNVIYTDSTYAYGFAEFQQVCNQDSNPADGSSSIQGELICTQDASQHNRGGGSVYNNYNISVSYQTMNQQSQMLCHSNCLTMTAVDHYLATRGISDCHNATLKYTNWHYFC